MVLTAFYIIQKHRIEEIKDNYEKLRIDTRQQFDYKEKDIKFAKEAIFDLNRRMEARGIILDSMRDDIYTLKEKMNKIISDDPKKRTREEISKLKYEKRIKKLKNTNETLSAELSRYTENINSIRAEDKKQIETNFAQKIKDEVGNYLYRTNFDGHNDFNIDYADLCCVIDAILNQNPTTNLTLLFRR